MEETSQQDRFLSPKILSVKHAPLVILGLFLLYTICTVIYNIYFHPLSKYPGPKLAAATELTSRYVSAKGNIIPWIQDLHSQYGEVVRLGPDKLSYISPQAWKDIYGHRTGGKKSNPKDHKFYAKAYNGHEDIITVQDDTEHARIRRIFSHAFSDKALKAQEGLIRDYVDQLIRNMRNAVSQEPKQKFDMVKMYNCTTFDIMGELAFGEPLGLLQQSEYTPWVDSVFGSIKAAEGLRIMLEYPLLGRIVRMIMPPSLREKEKMHFEHSIERVNRRLEKQGSGHRKPDIWNLVLEGEHGAALSREDMYANASLFMLAGTETTATLLSGLTFHLLRNPDKLKLLTDELRAAFSTDDELTIEGLKRLTYLNACLEEGLRLYPPVPIGPPREVPEGGNIIMGEWIPAKSRVSVAQYAAYHSPLNFKDPESFIPERWLPGTGFESDRKDAFQVFSFGPRNCIGKNLAYHEMRFILAKFLLYFDASMCPESAGWLNQKTYALWEKPPLMVQIKPVKQ